MQNVLLIAIFVIFFWSLKRFVLDKKRRVGDEDKTTAHSTSRQRPSHERAVREAVQLARWHLAQANIASNRNAAE